MKRFIAIILTFLILMTLNGCKSDNGEKQSEITVGNTKNVEIMSSAKKVPKKDKEDEKVLKKIGISTTNDGKIIIEPKKTKEFLEKIAKTLKKEAVRIKENNKDIKSEDLGISAKKDKIVIDVNKTEKFLDKLSKDFEKTAKELGNIFK